MPFRVKCPSCGRVQRIPNTDVGKVWLCKACGLQFDILPPQPGTLIPAESVPSVTNGTPPPTPSSTTPSSRVPIAAVLALVVIALVAGVFIGRLTGTSIPQVSAPVPAVAPVPITTTESLPIRTRITSQPPTTNATTAEKSPRPASIPSTAPASAPAKIASTAPTTTTVLFPPRIHPVPANAQSTSLEDQIGQLIDRGVAYLLNQFRDGRLREDGDGGGFDAGLDALAVYALLQAGQATHDDRLGPHTPLVDEMLKVLKGLPMEQRETYSRSLRICALALYNRAEDQKVLKTDTEWLMHASMDGAYTYGMPPRKESGGARLWDNSNSQYGALGVWAANDAGLEIPTNYWQKVEDHWLDCQLPTGEWGYSPGTFNGQLSMTVAGITTLFVAHDQLEATKNSTTLGRPPFIPALARGLQWLETDDNSINLPFSNKSYNLYGLECDAALASGFKYFGAHDWYRELARNAIISQMPSGAWNSESDPIVDTSFTLLFLSRGRHPIFMNKLRFDGFWANRPRDISNLTHYATRELERQLNWQVVSLNSDWTDWMDSPVLYIASHLSPKFTDDDCDKLRTFADNGGLIFTHADGDSTTFNHFVADLSKRLFPDYPLVDLPPNHEIYSTLFDKISPQPLLQGVSNGSRLLLINSPTDLDKFWQTRDYQLHPNPFQIGMNIFIYAAGKVNFRNKLRTTVIPQPTVKPITTVPVAQLRYPGNWNPEPAAWPRFARQFQDETSIKLSLPIVDLRDLHHGDMTIAHLTGTGETSFDARQAKAVHDFITTGGVLLIDSCGGSASFTQSVRDKLLPLAFPKTPLQSLPVNHTILAGTGEGMTPILPKLRPRAAELQGSPAISLQYLQEGTGAIIFSDVDFTTALLGTNTYTVLGCEPESAHTLTSNEVLWAIER